MASSQDSVAGHGGALWRMLSAQRRYAHDQGGCNQTQRTPPDIVADNVKAQRPRSRRLLQA
jgi:hypothetical protein